MQQEPIARACPPAGVSDLDHLMRVRLRTLPSRFFVYVACLALYGMVLGWRPTIAWLAVNLAGQAIELTIFRDPRQVAARPRLVLAMLGLNSILYNSIALLTALIIGPWGLMIAALHLAGTLFIAVLNMRASIAAFLVTAVPVAAYLSALPVLAIEMDGPPAAAGAFAAACLITLAYSLVLWRQSNRQLARRIATHRELVQRRREAEAAAEAKSQFLANMSHELRTPLSSVIGFAGLLRSSTELTGDAARFAERIDVSAQALLGLINDVLDYSKLDAGHLALDPQACDIGALMGEICEVLGLQASTKGIGLHCEIASDIERGRWVDDVRLRQVLTNLIGNAIKFTDEGRVRLELSALEREGAAWLRFEVEDTGPGLTAEQQERLFHRFVQADGSITRRHGGTGLGLAISKELVDLMGGEIGIDSRPGAGARFWFEIPAPVVELPETTVAPADAANLPRGRILVVDDHPINRELIRALLGHFPLEIDEAIDGLEAVEACMSKAYDLILMDVQMPRLDGLAAARRIRATAARNAHTPIVALSATAGLAQQEDFAGSGMDDALVKPIAPALLYDAIEKWLRREDAAHLHAS